MFIIKNISNDNIVFGKKTLYPGEEIPVQNLTFFQTLINLKKIEVIKEINFENNKTKINNNYINPNIKKNLIDSLFKLYLHQELSNDDLNVLKQFYKKMGFTRNIKPEILSLLDNVKNSEEFIEILLNNVYPELIDNNFQ